MKKLIGNLIYTLKKILLVTFIISSIIFYVTLLQINILDMKYIIPIGGILLIINLFLYFTTLRKKNKKRKKITWSMPITLLLSIILLFASSILWNTYSSIKDMFSNSSSISYSVIVKDTSNYQKILDIDNKSIGYYKEDKYTEKAKDYINEQINVEYIAYSSLENLYDALIEGRIQAIMIMDSYKEVISEESTRVIYTFKVSINHTKEVKDINFENGTFALFISGQDSFSSTVSETSRSDVNMLAVINLKTKEILLISIPRDYYIPIHEKNVYDKLTHISLYGSATAASSIGDILDVDIDYFIKFNFTTFMKAIEYLLPLDVYSDYDFTTDIYDETIGNTYHFNKGYNHITSGEMALQFVRARKNFTEGDRQRGINQTRFLKAVIQKGTEPSTLLKYKDILKSMNGTFLTNISDDSIIEMIKYVINNNGDFHISNYSLNGSDAYKTTYSTGRSVVYVMIPEQEIIEIASTYIKAILNGEVPDTEKDDADLVNSSTSKSVTKYSYEERYSTNENTDNRNKQEENQIIEKKEVIKKEETNRIEEIEAEEEEEEVMQEKKKNDISKDDLEENEANNSINKEEKDIETVKEKENS